MRRSNWKSGLVLPAIVLLSAGCGNKDSSELFGSCYVPRMSDQSTVCLEYATNDMARQFKQGCQPVMLGTWSDDACDTTGSLGGCDLGDNKIWLFPAGKYETTEDVVRFCESKEAPYLEP
jgi:hypothetical protein